MAEAFTKTLPTLRVFAPEQWGALDRFQSLYVHSFAFSRAQNRAVSGASSHMHRADRLLRVALKLLPDLDIDKQQLREHGYTPAHNSLELTAVIESILTSLYSALDCTTTVVKAVFRDCRGLPDSTSKMFARIREGRLDTQLAEPLTRAFKKTDWFGELHEFRSALTHLDTGSCRLDDVTGKVSYMHSGLGTKEKSHVVEDIFEYIDVLYKHVNQFIGTIFNHLNTLLSDETVHQVCAMHAGRMYQRYVIPSQTFDFHSGTCASYKWFELAENPTCPFAHTCGAYKRAKDIETHTPSVD